MANFKPSRSGRAAIIKATKASLTVGAVFVQTELKKELSKTGSGGRTSGAKYPRSVAGQPPTAQTGTLRRSVQAVDASEGVQLRSRVGTNVKYGRFLEFGTRKMQPRPWMRTTLARVKSKIPGVMSATLKRRLAS